MTTPVQSCAVHPFGVSTAVHSGVAQVIPSLATTAIPGQLATQLKALVVARLTVHWKFVLWNVASGSSIDIQGGGGPGDGAGVGGRAQGPSGQSGTVQPTYGVSTAMQSCEMQPAYGVSTAVQSSAVQPEYGVSTAVQSGTVHPTYGMSTAVHSCEMQPAYGVSTAEQLSAVQLDVQLDRSQLARAEMSVRLLQPANMLVVLVVLDRSQLARAERSVRLLQL